jgi:hypothetical protein
MQQPNEKVNPPGSVENPSIAVPNRKVPGTKTIGKDSNSSYLYSYSYQTGAERASRDCDYSSSRDHSMPDNTVCYCRSFGEADIVGLMLELV